MFFGVEFKSQQYGGTVYLAMNIYAFYFGEKKSIPLHIITNLIGLNLNNFKGQCLLKIV